MKMIVVQNPAGISIPVGGIAFWYGIAADVPSGWSIYTDANGRFVMGASVDGDLEVTGGNATHVHSNTGLQNSGHGHSASHAAANYTSSGTAQCNVGGYTQAQNGHYHEGKSASVAAESHPHTLADTGAASLLPLYVRLYLIESGGIPLPVKSVIMWDGDLATIPNGWHLCDGSTYDSIATPDLRAHFIYGAAADEDVGDVGGDTTHDHTNSNSQSVVSGSHSWSASYTSPSNTETHQISGGALSLASPTHRHDWGGSLGHSTPHEHTVGNTVADGDVTPEYVKLYFIMRTQ